MENFIKITCDTDIP